jgi:hypothetical protein
LGEPPLDRLGRINTQPGDRVTEGDKLRKLEADLWKAADQLRANSSLAFVGSRRLPEPPETNLLLLLPR